MNARQLLGSAASSLNGDNGREAVARASVGGFSLRATNRQTLDAVLGSVALCGHTDEIPHTEIPSENAGDRSWISAGVSQATCLFGKQLIVV
jgi:hypothetical protein